MPGPQYTTRIELSDYQRIVLALAKEANSSASRFFNEEDMRNALNWAWSETLCLLNFEQFKINRVSDAVAGLIPLPGVADGDIYPPVLAHYMIVIRKTSTDYQPLELRDAGILDQTDALWRTRTADVPTGFVSVVDPGGTASILLDPQPTTTITNGLFEKWTPRPAEMVDPTDTSPVGTLLPHRQQRLQPYGAIASLLSYYGGEEEQMAEWFRKKFEAEVEGVRSDLQMMFEGGIGLSRMMQGVGLG